MAYNTEATTNSVGGKQLIIYITSDYIELEWNSSIGLKSYRKFIYFYIKKNKINFGWFQMLIRALLRKLFSNKH